MAITNLQEIIHYEQFDNLEFIASRIVEGFITGLHRSPYHGFSVEFAEHRVYNSGESTKHIDWKLFARTEKLFVKQYEEETNLRSYVVLDTSSSMLFPYHADNKVSKLHFAVYCAAALIYMFKKQRDASGLCLFSDKIDILSDASLATTHFQMMYSQLQNLLSEDAISLNRGTATADVLHQLADTIHKRSLVLIFTDMFSSGNLEDIFSALQHIRHNKHEIIIFNVKDKQKEEQFQFSNRPHIFVDMESGEEIKFSPNEIRETYRRKMEELYREIEMKSRQYNIDYVEADINKDFREVLLPYLIKRSKLF